MHQHKTLIGNIQFNFTQSHSAGDQLVTFIRLQAAAVSRRPEYFLQSEKNTEKMTAWPKNRRDLFFG